MKGDAYALTLSMPIVPRRKFEVDTFVLKSCYKSSLSVSHPKSVISALGLGWLISAPHSSIPDFYSGPTLMDAVNADDVEQILMIFLKLNVWTTHCKPLSFGFFNALTLPILSSSKILSSLLSSRLSMKTGLVQPSRLLQPRQKHLSLGSLVNRASMVFFKLVSQV